MAKHALTAAECVFFDVNGTDRICHATGSAQNPYVIVQTSDSACINGHVGHASDYIATPTDQNCHGGGCFPVGAPVDPTIPCCPNLVAQNGICSNASGPEFNEFNVGGVDASPGEFPWTGILNASDGSICPAVLLSSFYALTSAHCVDGRLPSTLSVTFGVHDRTDLSGSLTSRMSSYTMHESYQIGPATDANDIAILNLADPIVLGGNIQGATLPPDNSNDFTGATVVGAGWGRTSSSTDFANIEQKASTTVIGTEECQIRLNPQSVSVWDDQLCTYDPANSVVSGGVLNAQLGVTVVVGIASFAIVSGGSPLPSYPQVFTRTSAYLSWIAANTP